MSISFFSIPISFFWGERLLGAQKTSLVHINGHKNISWHLKYVFVLISSHGWHVSDGVSHRYIGYKIGTFRPMWGCNLDPASDPVPLSLVRSTLLHDIYGTWKEIIPENDPYLGQNAVCGRHDGCTMHKYEWQWHTPSFFAFPCSWST